MQDVVTLVNMFGVPFAGMVVMGGFFYSGMAWLKPKADKFFDAHISLMATLEELSRENSRLLQEMHSQMFDQQP